MTAEATVTPASDSTSPRYRRETTSDGLPPYLANASRATAAPDAHRPESSVEAARLEAMLGELWRDHPRYTFIPARESMEEKLEEALAALRAHLAAVNHG